MLEGEENLKEGTVTDISSKDPESTDLEKQGFSRKPDGAIPAPLENKSVKNKRYRRIRESKLKSERIMQEPSKEEVPFSFGEKSEQTSSERADPKVKKRLDHRTTTLSSSQTEERGKLQDGYTGKLKENEEVPEEDLSGYRETITRKRKRKQLYETQRRKGRLLFSDPSGPYIPGRGQGTGKKLKTARRSPMMR